MQDFDYQLPDSQIAQYPLPKRDESRLLINIGGKIEHDTFKNLAKHIPHNAHLVFNNTKVIPARLVFYKASGARIEVFLLEPILPSVLMEKIFEVKFTCTWNCTIGNKKKWKSTETLFIDTALGSFKAELLTDNEVQFSWASESNFGEILFEAGNVPLPPYMNRTSESEDEERYQTIFAKQQGAVAAPTASLHFTDEVFESLKVDGNQISYLTLHVGAGTFLPVKTDFASDHAMHSEQIVFTKEFIEDLLKNHTFVISAGTTALRSLESLYWFGQKLEHDINAPFFIEKLLPYNFENEVSLIKSLKNVLEYMISKGLNKISGNTEIMIMPGYAFKICKGIITNFHQPGSTLLLLIAALIGQQNWKPMYEEALNQNYRFLSYGDASLLIPQNI
jgi:S-adenosylmethionine:tRNA ribosyltransferase-isomerase